MKRLLNRLLFWLYRRLLPVHPHVFIARVEGDEIVNRCGMWLCEATGKHRLSIKVDPHCLISPSGEVEQIERIGALVRTKRRAWLESPTPTEERVYSTPGAAQEVVNSWLSLHRGWRHFGMAIDGQHLDFNAARLRQLELGPQPPRSLTPPPVRKTRRRSR